MMKYLMLLAIFALGGCAYGAVPWNTQNYAGINKAEINFNEDGTLSHVLVIGGKEQESVSANFEMPSGLKFSYNAEGVEAFPGQKFRADVERAISKDVKEAFPGIVDTIVDALR